MWRLCRRTLAAGGSGPVTTTPTKFPAITFDDADDLARFVALSLGRGSDIERRARLVALLADQFRRSTAGSSGVYRQLALLMYRRALDLDPMQTWTNVKIAEIYLSQRHTVSEESAELASSHLEFALQALDPNDSERLTIVLNLLALARSSSSNNRQSARETYGAAIAVASRITSQERERRRGDVLVNLGNFEADEGAHDLAIRYYREACDLYRSAGISLGEQLVLRNLAGALIEHARALLDVDRTTASLHVEEALCLLDTANAKTPSAKRIQAAIRVNRAMACMLRVRGSRQDNFAAALAEYASAAELFRQAGESAGQCTATVGAGGALYELGRWSEAYSAFLQAIDMVDDEWRDCNTSRARLALTRRHGTTFGLAVASAIKAGDANRALLVLERGRARLLRDTVYSNQSIVPVGMKPEAWGRLMNCRIRRLDVARRLTEVDSGQNPNSVPARIKLLEVAEDERNRERHLLHTIRSRSFPSFGSLPAITHGYVEVLSRKLETQLWFLKPTAKGTAFIVADPIRGISSHLLQNANHKRLSELLLGKTGWFRTYSEPELWKKRMNVILSKLCELIVGPCLELSGLRTAKLARRGSKGTGYRPRVYILAGGVLGLLPLHATPCDNYGARHLIDLTDVSYFPSTHLLREAEGGVTAASRLLFFKAPDTPFADVIEAAVLRMFRHQAKVSCLAERVVKHEIEQGPADTLTIFACHAAAIAQDVFKSGICFRSSQAILPELSLSELLDISCLKSRVVVLNGCETALTEIEDPADECLSIANCFLARGTRSVVGTQWKANAYSAALWCLRFLELTRAGELDNLGASCGASRWLRDSSESERIRLLDQWSFRPEEVSRLERLDFAHPFHWANHKFHGAA